MTHQQIEAYFSSIYHAAKKSHGNLDDLEIAAILGYGSSFIIYTIIPNLAAESRKFGAACAILLDMPDPRKNGRTSSTNQEENTNDRPQEDATDDPIRAPDRHGDESGSSSANPPVGEAENVEA